MNPSPHLHFSDDDFIATFERGGFDRSSFPHRAHLRMAWLYVRHLGLARAIDKATAGIRALAEQHGHAGLYHDTVTRAWVYLVAAATGECPEVADFDQFLRRQPELLDKNCLRHYYSPDRLSSPQARTGWLSPDRCAIPGAPDPDEAEDAVPIAPLAPMPAEEFRLAWQRVPSPVAVMTARDATRIHGTTVSSVVSVSLTSALLLICVRRDSRILEVARSAGGFAISYLASDQQAIATHFADPARVEGVGQFHGIPHIAGRHGAPVITGGPVWFECRLADEFAAADHQVVCGTVVAQGGTGTQPLRQLGGAWL